MKNNKSPATRRPQPSPNPANQARNSLPWRSLEQQVIRAQKQIAQAAQRGDRQAVYTLQQRLMEAEAARLLAVRRAAEENAGKDTAGVDGIKSLGPRERLVMASTIHPKNWNQQPPMPVRRVWIPKPGTNQRRPLGILSMIDRCKQALVKLALEPEWEVKFELHSYGFRPGRGVHDAIAAITVAIERQPMFVFDSDIAEAFDSVSQAIVLDRLQTYPVLRRVIAAWLTAGVLDGDTWFPSETGIAQGGVLSPLLMNVALHGMEAVVTQGTRQGYPYHVTSGSGEQRDMVGVPLAGTLPLLVRYADDFVILHPDLKELQQAIRRVRRWLASIGLHLNTDKTRITHTFTPYSGQLGFDFLGFHIRQESILPASNASYRVREGLAPSLENTRIKTIIIPSEEASRRHLASIDQRLQQLQTAPQLRVIEELNPLIIGWVAHYNGIVAPAILGRYDVLLEQRLLKWAGKRHPGKERDWLLNRYWQHTGNRRVFATGDGVQLRVYRQASILKG